jgi:hypothetical protein
MGQGSELVALNADGGRTQSGVVGWLQLNIIEGWAWGEHCKGGSGSGGQSHRTNRPSR